MIKTGDLCLSVIFFWLLLAVLAYCVLLRPTWWIFCLIANKWTGSDAILLGAETLRGLYPVETISTVGRICSEVSLLYGSLILFYMLDLYWYLDSGFMVSDHRISFYVPLLALLLCHVNESGIGVS